MRLPAIVALWIGIAVLVILSLTPPWYSAQMVVNGNFNAYIDGGHNFILNPPRMPNACPFVDLSRLVPMWVAVASITLGAVVTLNKQ